MSPTAETDDVKQDRHWWSGPNGNGLWLVATRPFPTAHNAAPVTYEEAWAIFRARDAHV